MNFIAFLLSYINEKDFYLNEVKTYKQEEILCFIKK
jgi:hypothetical protein